MIGLCHANKALLSALELCMNATYKNMPNIDQINNLNRELFMQDYLQCWGYVFLAALAFSTTSLGM